MNGEPLPEIDITAAPEARHFDNKNFVKYDDKLFIVKNITPKKAGLIKNVILLNL